MSEPVSSQEHDEHYRNMAIEPMHRSLENDLDAAQHTICKYVERHKVKGGVRDLEAARDVLIDYIDYVRYGTWKGKRMVTNHTDVQGVNEDALCNQGVHRFQTMEDGKGISRCLNCDCEVNLVRPMG